MKDDVTTRAMNQPHNRVVFSKLEKMITLLKSHFRAKVFISSEVRSC